MFLPSQPEGERKYKEENILSSQILGKDNVASIFTFTDSPIYIGQQSVCEKVFLQEDSNLFWKEEGKATRALRGTQAKFETISLYRRKICYLGPH